MPGSHTPGQDTQALTYFHQGQPLCSRAHWPYLNWPILSPFTKPCQILCVETTTKVLVLSLCLMTDPVSRRAALGHAVSSPRNSELRNCKTLSSFSLLIYIWPHHASLKAIWLKWAWTNKEAIQRLSLIANVWWLPAADQNLKNPTREVLQSQKWTAQHVG